MNGKTNLASSVAARLLNRARQTGDDYQTLLTSYRIKDFFDLHYLASHFEFDRATLVEAVRRTFERRRTPIPEEQPIALTRGYWDNPSRPAQVRAFARRARIAVPEDFADECARTLDAFVSPVLQDLRSERASVGTWPPGGPWEQVFPGVAAIKLTAMGSGPSLDLRISKKEGIPIRLVPEGTLGATVVAVHKVDALGFYNLGRDQVAEHLGLSGPRTTALIQHTKIKEDPECFRRIAIGRASFDRYSQKAIERLLETLRSADMDHVWAEYQTGVRRKTRA